MSNSEKLRETQTGQCNIFNTCARNQENPVREASYKIVNDLRATFGENAIGFDKEIKKVDLKKYSVNPDLFGSNFEKKTSAIKPDSGIIFYRINEIKFILLASEAKKQGTNDIRIAEGKKKQAQGNAIERAFKNFSEICVLSDGYGITPYSLFCSGCDFEVGSSIRDRLSSMTRHMNYNEIYLKDLSYGDYRKRGSVFVRKDKWTLEEIFNINRRIAFLAAAHLLDKFKAYTKEQT